MPAMRPASAKRQAKRQSPTRSRTMRSYLRYGAGGRPRIAPDARHLRRCGRFVRGTGGARPHGSSVCARSGRRPIPGWGALLSSHAGGGGSLPAVRLAHRPLRRTRPPRVLAGGRGRFAARRRSDGDRASAVRLAGRGWARRGRPAGGAVFGCDGIGEIRPAGSRDGLAHHVDAGRFFRRPIDCGTPSDLARHPDRPRRHDSDAGVRSARGAAGERHSTVSAAWAVAARDRWPIVFVGVIVWSAAAVVLGHLTGLWGPAILLIAATPFMATAFVAIGVVFGDLSAASTRGVTMGMYGTILFLGLAAGPLVFGSVVKNYGYAAGFTACAVVAIVLALVMGAFHAEPLRRRVGVRLPPPTPGT